ncbi:MAG: aminotransferase class I/II-fold pyridoxal phosphate-dependent enzyme [Candidatus Levybacteria bacterium]|nr:aminotransferase class I/II-fold pyridoxal phosphate-dependent enzyme [Candidatus Levybacteria bacterium]MDZ4228281.1 aminotransferase class I/II-fold pyridoxal phosphate-dependent enzyme [Candidatus Levybacteria bacterium]
MNVLFRKAIIEMEQYSPPLEGRTKKGYLLLDFNERTISPHPLVQEDVKNYVKNGHFQIYPEYGNLNEILSKHVGVKSDEIISTNGADQAIDIIIRGIVGNKDRIIIPEPSFPIFRQSADIQGARVLSPRYGGENLEFPLDETLETIEPGVKMVIVCNPNNPTGGTISRRQLSRVIQRAHEVRAAVMVDETYHVFSPNLSVVNLIGKFDNLFIVRSFAKSMGIPGLRAGYVISQSKNIGELEKIRGPYDVSMPATVAMRSLKYPEVVRDMKAYAQEVMKVSKPMIEDFYKKNDIRFFPSGANFHLIEDKNGDITDFFKSKGILVRPRSDPRGMVRISIGTRENTVRCIKTFQEYLNSSK